MAGLTWENDRVRMLLFQGEARYRFVGVSGVGQAIKQQARILERLGVDVVTDPGEDHEVAQFNVPFVNSYLQARRSRRAAKKIVWVAHSTEADIRGSLRGSDAVAPLLRRLYQMAYSTADLVLTPTPYARRLWLSYGLEVPIEAVSNGVDTEFFRADAEAGQRFRDAQGYAADAKVVVGVGHYFRRKGIVDFVELARRFPEVEFIWFGHTDRGMLTRDVRAALSTAPSNCRFPGFVSREELRDAYCGADLFLFPTYEETQGIVLLEALACEVPVLIRDIPVYEGWLREGEHAHMFRTVPELVDRTAAILDGSLPLPPDGRALAGEHDYARVAEHLRDIYERHGIL